VAHHKDEDDTRRASCMVGSLVRNRPSEEITCAASAAACWRGERFVKASRDAGVLDLAGSCTPTPPCGRGELFDEAVGRCANVTRGPTVDVATWARVVLGPDGAEGAPDFCAPVRLAEPHGRFQVQLTFPDNDVTQVAATVTAETGTTGTASDAAQRSVDQLLGLLRALGGTASAASVTLGLGCTAPTAVNPSLETVGDAGR
jgi:hypothetical protein